MINKHYSPSREGKKKKKLASQRGETTLIEKPLIHEHVDHNTDLCTLYMQL